VTAGRGPVRVLPRETRRRRPALADRPSFVRCVKQPPDYLRFLAAFFLVAFFLVAFFAAFFLAGIGVSLQGGGHSTDPPVVRRVGSNAAAAKRTAPGSGVTQMASLSDVKLKSRTLSAGTTMGWPGPPLSLAETRTGTPIISRLFSMKIGDSL